MILTSKQFLYRVPQQTVALALLLLLLSCANTNLRSGDRVQSAPQSTHETGAIRSNLQDKIDFIEQYVIFEGDYESLEYDVFYQYNEGDRVPGPSDWNIRILAIVPTAQLEDWIPDDISASNSNPPDWVGTIPGSIPTDGISEWYIQSGKAVGLDRSRSIVAYRLSTMGSLTD